jgi:hypothetical protein
MSKAEPMDSDARLNGYARRNGIVTLTPAQWRRTRHKWNRHNDGYYIGFGGKGRATPRRPRRG